MKRVPTAEEIVAATARQAQALFPQAEADVIRHEARELLKRKLREAKRKFPNDRPQQLAYAQAEADNAIRLNLGEIKIPTMH